MQKKFKKYFWSGFTTLLAVGLLSLFTWAMIHGSSFDAALIRVWTKAQILVSRVPEPTVLLPVSFDKQDHKLSCEVAGLKMLLTYRGVNVSENELLKKIGVDPTPKTFLHGVNGAAGILQWGDPQKSFVGDVDGNMLQNGYGVHWDPIARVAKEYRSSYAIEHWELPDLSYELDHGNPIMIWGYLGNGRPTSWQTVTGKTVNTIYYEHIFVVNGYSGTSKNPTGFHVIDTLYGQRYYPAQEFLTRWSALGRSGVVVL